MSCGLVPLFHVPHVTVLPAPGLWAPQKGRMGVSCLAWGVHRAAWQPQLLPTGLWGAEWALLRATPSLAFSRARSGEVQPGLGLSAQWSHNPVARGQAAPRGAHRSDSALCLREEVPGLGTGLPAGKGNNDLVTSVALASLCFLIL